MSIRDHILKKDDLKRIKVPIPEWEIDVYVTEMTGTMRDQFELQFAGKARNEAMKNLRAFYAIYCTVDKNGNPIFKPEDADQVGKKSSIALDRIQKIAEDLNHIFTNSEDEAKNS